MKEIDAVTIAAKRRHLHLLEKVKKGISLTKAELKELKGFETLGKKKKTDNEKTGGAALAFDTQKEAAQYAGVSERTIRNWVGRGMPLADGKYAAVFLDVMKAQDGSPAEAVKDRKNEAEAENKELKNQLLEMDVKLRTGKLISIEEVNAGRVERIQQVKKTLMALPRKLPGLLKDKSPRQMTETIRREIEHCINIFAGKK